MRSSQTSLAIIVLLAALALATVLALPRGMGAATASAPAAPASAPLIEPAAPQGTQKYNAIALPLNSTQQFAGLGLSYDAAGLAGLVGTGVKQVLKWNAPTQTYLVYDAVLNDGDNFSLATGEVYWLLLDSTASNIVSFVGDVPAIGSVTFSLVRPTGGGCRLNDISIPLHRSDLTTPAQLASSIGNVAQVMQWNATSQTFLVWDVDLNDGDSFPIKIGYPYRVCLKSGGSTTWP